MLTDDQRVLLAQGAAQWGIHLSATDLDRFARFASLLEAGNLQLNLTRVRPEDFVPLHFLDSLALAATGALDAGARLIDVGTGAGFPGVPLALAYPELKVTLLDSTRKRLAFLDDVVEELGLENARTLHGRAEELARDPLHRERYDLVTARAVAQMSTLAGWMLPLTHPGGLAAAYKTHNAAEEIEAARPQIGAHGGVIERVADVTIPGTDIARKLVLIRKRRTVPLHGARRRRERSQNE